MNIKKIVVITGACFASFGMQAVPHHIFLERFSKFGLDIPANAITMDGNWGQNNGMSIGPWEGSFKPGSFHKRNQDTFNVSDSGGNKPLYNELEWYEVDPQTMEHIRHCHVVLNGTVEYESNIYIKSNCRIHVWEPRPGRWTQRVPATTGLRAEAWTTNQEIPGDATTPGMAAFRARTGITGNEY